MNWKTFAVAFVGVLVVSNVGGLVVHGWLLQGDYAQFPNLLRTQEDANAHFPFMLLNFIFYSLGFVWIYAQGVEHKPWVGQGLRFGAAVWLITSVAFFLTYYAVQPWPGELVAKQIGYELMVRLAEGLTVAALYKK